MTMESSNSNIIDDNEFVRLVLEHFGIGCLDNTVIKNRVTGNGGINDGILVMSGSNNTISANNIRNCESGLSLSDSVTETSVHLNNFISNSINIEYYGDANWTSNNRFDNGAKGNYYDDYTGADNNWDGIGDVPFTIKGTRWDNEAGGVVEAGFSQDRYPFMAPFDIDSVSIELPNWASPLLNPSPEPQKSEPFPTSFIATASVIALVVVGTGLLVYFKKSHHLSGLFFASKQAPLFFIFGLFVEIFNITALQF
jgi:hypothetical protein